MGSLAVDQPPSMPVLSTPAAARSGQLSALVRALRVHQWAKNALVFLPVLLAHRVEDAERLVAALTAFVALSLCASGAYVVNDVLDREQDRRHPVKRHRPFASGALAPGVGYVLAPLLVAAGAGLSLALLPPAFTALLGIYVAATLAYSFVLKRLAVVDVLVLAGLYVLRVLAGAAATGVPASQWLLAFSLFFFLCLALLKRYAELRMLETTPEARANGRGYEVDDVSILRGVGPSTGLLAVLVLTLYATDPAVARLYAHPERLWLVTPLLLYWTMRAWLLAHRGVLTGDPVTFTLLDPASWAVGAGVVAVLVAAA